MKSLVLDGKTFIKASEAAKDAGYTSDYVGQLCRSGKIAAQLVGRSWYVDQEDLRSHRATANRSSKATARKEVHLAVGTSDDSDSDGWSDTPEHFMTRGQSSVSYIEDEHDLIPDVKKLSVQTEPVKIKSTKKSSRTKKTITPEVEEAPYTIEHEGEKIIMSGQLDVLDLNDEEYVDADTVSLHADLLTEEEVAILQRAEKKKADKKKREEEKKAAQVKALEDTPEEVSDELDTVDGSEHAVSSSFLEKIQLTDDAQSSVEVKADDIDETHAIEIQYGTEESSDPQVVTGPRSSGFMFVATTTFLSLILAGMLILPEMKLSYYATDGLYDGAYIFETTIKINIDGEALMAKISR